MIDGLGDGLHSPVDAFVIRDIENDRDDGRSGEGDSGSFDGIERSPAQEHLPLFRRQLSDDLQPMPLLAPVTRSMPGIRCLHLLKSFLISVPCTSVAFRPLQALHVFIKRPTITRTLEITHAHDLSIQPLDLICG
jgi:hypothetical protein